MKWSGFGLHGKKFRTLSFSLFTLLLFKYALILFSPIAVNKLPHQFWRFRRSKWMNFSSVSAVATCVFILQHTALHSIPTISCTLHWQLDKQMLTICYLQNSLITYYVMLLLVCTVTGQRNPSTLLTFWFSITIVWLTLHKDSCFRAWEKVCEE